MTSNITFAVAVNHREVFSDNFLAAPFFCRPHNHEILVQENFDSAAKAYNDAIDRSSNDLIVFAHQDVFLPESWPWQLARALDFLGLNDPRWGVLGCFGRSCSGDRLGHVYSSGLGVIGMPLEHPTPVQTLDEIVLIVRKSSGLRFDENLPHFHLYGTDICLRAAEQGMKNYAISAFCVHNTRQIMVLPREFYACCKYIRRSWREHLPIQTTCVRLTKLNLPVYRMQLQEIVLRIRRKDTGAERAKKPHFPVGTF